MSLAVSFVAGARARVSDAFAPGGAKAVKIIGRADLVHEFNPAGASPVYCDDIAVSSRRAG